MVLAASPAWVSKTRACWLAPMSAAAGESMGGVGSAGTANAASQPMSAPNSTPTIALRMACLPSADPRVPVGIDQPAQLRPDVDPAQLAGDQRRPLGEAGLDTGPRRGHEMR